MSAAAGATGETAKASEATTPGAARHPEIDLRPLYAPRSVAVVGASPRSDLARTMRDNIAKVGSETRCFFVNPRYEEIDGSPAYPDLAGLPEVPDAVVVALNPLRAAGVVREVAAAGVRAVIIPGGGIVEGGEPAAAMQREVAAIAREAGIALLGPNCMGLVDLTAPSATYIDDLPPNLRRGGTAAIAQSGSVTDAFVHAGTRIGWSRIVSVGSEAVLDLCDHLAACLDDPHTDSIVLFVEGFKRPERFLALADRALAEGKPILALKVGRSSQARAAAVAHTGNLAGDDRAVDAALRAAGVVRFDDLDDLIEAAALASRARRLGRGVGKGRTGVLTVSTGEGSLVADLAPTLGLDLPPIPAEARARIAQALPTLTHIENPLDPWGADEGAPTYRACFEAFVASGAYDVVALVHDFPYRSQPGEVALAVELGAELVAATAEAPQVLPVFVSLTSGDVTQEVEAQMDAAGGVPILRGTRTAFGAIAKLAWWERRRAARITDGPVRAAWPALASATPRYIHGRVGRPSSATPRAMPERESLELLRAAGLPMVESTAVRIDDEDAMVAEATAAAQGYGWPVVVKVDAPGFAHKTDAGGVALGIADPTTLGRAIRAMHPTASRGVLVQPMVKPGVELIVGGRRDAQFGPLVLVGLGGILAEAIDDVAVRLAPVTEDEALAMLGELRGARILDGPRNLPTVRRRAVAEAVAALGRAMLANPTWLEVDLNPVIAGPGGAIAVDALVVTADVADPAWDYEDPGGAEG
ncbi:MAG TPA: acetate--CoA ligase family protein [Candidatus Limnocylindrales bacterium]|nr:acetate--CoA ligase family protein [Candidatus Limnocylindrales bacterium]